MGILALLVALASDAQEVRWFVVSEIEPNRNQSYLLPLADPEAIEQARVLVDQGPGNGVGSIASVRISAGPNGFNRDVLAEGSPLWSWHVTEFLGFADLAIELCDGWPGFIEQDVGAFIRNTQGQVCFWGYTVTAELDEAPLFRINSSLNGGWFNPATPGQGLMIDVLDDDQMFVAWFTFEEMAAKIGAPEHRWLTAQGGWDENRADLGLTLTTGGVFDAPEPVENAPVGTLELIFEHCNRGEAVYRFSDGNPPDGTFPIQRLVPDPSCQPGGGEAM
ncbi:MAG: hypothetical protein R3200_00230 [Xanthomonadales bacterium]|nr:hypothetical protein [Xanthomonadales bacterium]